MNILSRKSTANYANDRLVAIARHALAADPLISDPDVFTVTSNKGVVRLQGTVHHEEEKRRIETAVYHAYQATGLKFDHITNELRVVTP